MSQSLSKHFRLLFGKAHHEQPNYILFREKHVLGFLRHLRTSVPSSLLRRPHVNSVCKTFSVFQIVKHVWAKLHLLGKSVSACGLALINLLTSPTPSSCNSTCLALIQVQTIIAFVHVFPGYTSLGTERLFCNGYISFRSFTYNKYSTLHCVVTIGSH